MSEKKVVKMSLGTAVGIVIIMILLMIVIAISMYGYGIKKANAENDNVVNNSDTNLNENNELDQENISSDKDMQIEGKFNVVGNEDSEMISYTFEDGKVTYNAMDSAEGTYIIEDNKIKITYDVAYDPEGEELDYFPNGEEEELTIVDENTLTSEKIINDIAYNGKYVKE